jgi:hypothetical protein
LERAWVQIWEWGVDAEEKEREAMRGGGVPSQSSL